ncbi:uncharacterized protein LOC107360821 [Tetranychus urticae]|uniref:Platelet-derived growth factor (PDGF) family profile domain-containing protein n=1 Tax=Tetranychus urticae TaxID=32264 RepID=T1K676_TETUR|nr:uncharacterized protein LOC107360821 [Tetranychus urticae]
MFNRTYSLSFLLFYVCHLLVITAINGQHYRPQHEPRQYSGYHKITTLPDGETHYSRSYILNDTGYSEHLYTKPQTYGRSVSQPLNHQLLINQGYSPNVRRNIGADPEFTQALSYKSLPPPLMVPQLQPQLPPQLPPQFRPLPSRLPAPMAGPIFSSAVAPLVSPNIPRNRPVVPQNSRQNQPNYQPNYQPDYQPDRDQYRSEYSRNTYQRQAVSGNEVTVPHSYNVPDEPMNRMIDFFSSSFFKSNVKENKLTTVNLFQNVIIGTNTTADEAIIKANLEKTAGHVFDNGSTDCKPVMTVVKFGNINKPEIIYNPSSVQVLRCPQACFSWQFDCLPVKKHVYNFSAAVYTMEKGKVTREVNQFEVVSHTECACQCKTVASCLSSSSLSTKRPISNGF